jgi:electron transfer flavoprotein alpha/beta subunit
MNILVILRAVPDPSGFTVNRRAQKVFVNREEDIVNPSDKNALEAALALATENDTVVAVALGEAPAEDALRQARAMGAGRALLVRDASLKNADAMVVAAALRRLVHHLDETKLVLLGAEVLDADLAQVGPRLAAALDWPFVAGAHQLELHGAALTALVPQPDAFHKLEADLPVVVAVAPDCNQPRYAPGARIINVYKDKSAVETHTAGDLQLSESDLTPVVERRGESFPPERELGKRLEGDLDEVARQVAEVIRKA